VHQAARIATIGEDPGDEREALARCLQWQLAAVAVLDVGSMNADGE
jgi:hypothetical protein